MWEVWRGRGTSTETCHCANATEFISGLLSFTDEVSARNGGPRLASKAMFRGVGNGAVHRLVPTALRTEAEDPKSHLLLSSCMGKDGVGNSHDQLCTLSQLRRAELKIVELFYRSAEQAGLSLPEISDERWRNELLTGRGYTLRGLASTGRKVMRDTGQMTPHHWPPAELLPIIGLAQHYGLPTRLLDWSYSPLVAAYFAASSALRMLEHDPPQDAYLCVWGTYRDFFTRYGEFDGFGGKLAVADFPARLVQPPTASNPNLQRQQGVFTVIRDPLNSEPESPIDRREVTDVLDDFATAANEDKTNPLGLTAPLFMTLSLPMHHSADLLLRLAELGVSANTMFDGFAGAAENVRLLTQMASEKLS